MRNRLYGRRTYTVITYKSRGELFLWNIIWELCWFWAGRYSYRVSHSKVSKVILLCWDYRFRFMLIFWILRVHGIWASVFIFLMLRPLYRMIPKNPKLFFGKNNLNVPNVKLLSNFFFYVFGFFMPFWWE